MVRGYVQLSIVHVFFPRQDGRGLHGAHFGVAVLHRFVDYNARGFVDSSWIRRLAPCIGRSARHGYGWVELPYKKFT